MLSFSNGSGAQFRGFRTGLLGTTALAASLATFTPDASAQNWNSGAGDLAWGTNGNWNTSVPNSDSAVATLFNAPNTITLTGGADVAGPIYTLNRLNFSNDFTLTGGTLVFDGANAGIDFRPALSGAAAAENTTSSLTLQLDSDLAFTGVSSVIAGNITTTNGSDLTISSTLTVISGDISDGGAGTVSYTHLTLPTNREV